MPAFSFFTGDDTGRISAITEFRPEPYDPPAGREHLTERYGRQGWVTGGGAE
ncbi:hypothetical protein [Streptomyces sp. enrichment culture]|uniref:hypothetical protein n=1 Tax=Streptomyces sp. enrichment culture TaxID=1795815 RepID=UPI003F56842A